MHKLSYEEKVEAVKSLLGKTSSQLNAEKLAEHQIFMKEKQRIKDEEEKANTEAEAKRQALQASENERVRLDKVKREDAAMKLKKRTQALIKDETDKRKVREANARNWIERMKWEHIAWQHRKQNFATGKITWKEVGKEPIKPTAHWFDNKTWYIKEQFGKYYDK